MFKPKFQRLALVAGPIASIFFASGCGPSTTASSHSLAAVNFPAPDPIDKKLFYDFPLAQFDAVSKDFPGSDHYDATLAKSEFFNRSWVLQVYEWRAGTQARTWDFNLESGTAEGSVEPEGYSVVEAPTKGGNAAAYLKVLRSMLDILKTLEVPANTLAYVGKVIDFVSAANPYAVSVAKLGDSAGLQVDLQAKTDVDVLVDVFHTPDGSAKGISASTWFTSGRVTAKTGTYSVALKLAKANADLDHSCVLVKLLPVGSDYTRAIASTQLCAKAEPVLPPVPTREPITTNKAFDFPLSTYPSHIESAPAPNAADATINLAVTADSIVLIHNNGANSGDFTDYFEFHLATGNIDYKGDHADGFSYALPAYGGDLNTYKNILPQLQDLLEKAKAPSDVKSYLQSVTDYVNTHTLDSVANNYDSAEFHWNKDNELIATYTATGEREILTEIQNGNYSWTRTFRTRVSAGSGSVAVHFPLPAKGTESSICMNMNIVPVGGSEVFAQNHPNCHQVQD